MKKMAVVTSTRADYGLLKYLMWQIREHEAAELYLVVTGTHTNPEFGYTVDEISADGFQIDTTIAIQTSDDTAMGVSRGFGDSLTGATQVFKRLLPDVVIVLGDRYEILAITVSALVSGIPVAHLHGGEVTSGAFDDAIRHAITKLSDLHFVASDVYKKRVLQMGEDPKTVFLVGGLGVDSISKTKLLTRSDVEKALGRKFLRKNIIVTFHPVTLQPRSADEQIQELLHALDELEDTNIIITLPNADPENRIIRNQIKQFCDRNPNAEAYPSLGHRLYLSCLYFCDGVVGNSSSGIAEVPTMQKATINIGDRQSGRLKSNSVIDCDPTAESIGRALKLMYSREFQKKLSTAVNPYGSPGASEKIFKHLLDTKSTELKRKTFVDLSFDV